MFQAIANFFGRLGGVHLLFWKLSFTQYDAIPMFVAILAAIGAASGDLKETIQSAAFQFTLAVPSFLFCYVWFGARSNYVSLGNNLICLCLSISLLSCLLAFLIKFILLIPPLHDTVGIIFSVLNEELKDFSWDTAYSWTIVFFISSTLAILTNTIRHEGITATTASVLSVRVVAILMALLLSLLASLVTAVPVIRSMNI